MPWAGSSEVVAERNLTITAEDGETRPVTVRIGKPIRTPGANDFFCEVQIEGLGRDRIHNIYGLDQFQALQLALSFIAIIATVVHHHRGETRGRLHWLEAGDDLGFSKQP